MRRITTVAMAVFAATCFVGAAPVDPLANARAGMVQCYEPNVARKTCNSIASYTFTKGHEIENGAEVLMSPHPLVVMKAVSPVEIRGSAVCGPLRKKDIDQATIVIGGWPASAEQAGPIKAQIEASDSSRWGKEVCTVYEPKGKVLIARVTLDGKPEPDLAQEVIWVRPDDGYTVAP